MLHSLGLRLVRLGRAWKTKNQHRALLLLCVLIFYEPVHPSRAEREREKRERDVATKQFQILPWVAKIVILPLHPYMNAPRVLQERLVSAQGVV